MIERLGKYKKSLEAGVHILMPFLDKVAYKHSLKEVAVDVPPQTCITGDNITVEIDGILYMRVIDPVKASKRSEGERTRMENEAKGRTAAILEVAQAINEPGGKESVSMRIAQEWIESFAKLAKTNNSMIIPTNLADIASVTAILKNVFEFAKPKEKE